MERWNTLHSSQFLLLGKILNIWLVSNCPYHSDGKREIGGVYECGFKLRVPWSGGHSCTEMDATHDQKWMIIFDLIATVISYDSTLCYSIGM